MEISGQINIQGGFTFESPPANLGPATIEIVGTDRPIAEGETAIYITTTSVSTIPNSTRFLYYNPAGAIHWSNTVGYQPAGPAGQGRSICILMTGLDPVNPIGGAIRAGTTSTTNRASGTPTFQVTDGSSTNMYVGLIDGNSTPTLSRGTNIAGPLTTSGGSLRASWDQNVSTGNSVTASGAAFQQAIAAFSFELKAAQL